MSKKKGVTASFPNQLQTFLFFFSNHSSGFNCHLHIPPVKTNLRNNAFSGPAGLAPTSRRGCSRKAANKDRPAGLLAGKPENRRGSGPGCPAR